MPLGAALRGDHWKPLRKTRPEGASRIEKHAPAIGDAGPDRARHHVARLELAAAVARHEPFAGVVDQDRAFAAHRLAHQRHRVEADIERGRVELHELHVGERRTGTGGERQSLSNRAERIGGVAVKPADAACRHDHPRARQQQRPALRQSQHACDLAVVDDQPARLHVLQ